MSNANLMSGTRALGLLGVQRSFEGIIAAEQRRADPASRTVQVGSNASKRQLGTGKRRVRMRKAIQRAERAKLQGQKEAA